MRDGLPGAGQEAWLGPAHAGGGDYVPLLNLGTDPGLRAQGSGLRAEAGYEGIRGCGLERVPPLLGQFTGVKRESPKHPATRHMTKSVCQTRGLMKQHLWTGEAIFNDLINYHYILTMIVSGNEVETGGNVQERWV